MGCACSQEEAAPAAGEPPKPTGEESRDPMPPGNHVELVQGDAAISAADIKAAVALAAVTPVTMPAVVTPAAVTPAALAAAAEAVKAAAEMDADPTVEEENSRFKDVEERAKIMRMEKQMAAAQVQVVRQEALSRTPRQHLAVNGHVRQHHLKVRIH